MKHLQVGVIGCGVIGAAIAYELSRAGVAVTVWESRSQPGKGATGAALGVLMAACSRKAAGDLVALRLWSLQRYESLVAELVSLTGWEIPYRQGILCLYQDPEMEAKWRSLILIREEQGFALRWLSADDLRAAYPAFQARGGLWSPRDRGIHPRQLTAALVQAASQLGARFIWNAPVTSLSSLPNCDRVIISAGMGSTTLLAEMRQIPDLLTPVGGQALRVRASLPKDTDAMPIATSIVHAESVGGEDINFVPLGNDEYWVGATVEFDTPALPHAANVSRILGMAAQFCPSFQDAEVLETWAGFRPRPQGRRSPVLGFLPGSDRVLVATGHYRNGVLMAPVTARILCDLVLHGDSDLPWRQFDLSRSPN